MESRGCHRSFPRVCKHAQPICSTQLNIVGQEMNSWFGPGGTGKGYLVQSPDSRQHFSKYGKSCKVLQKSSELGHDSASVGDWHCIVVYQRRNNSTVKKKTKKKPPQILPFEFLRLPYYFSNRGAMGPFLSSNSYRHPADQCPRWYTVGNVSLSKTWLFVWFTFYKVKRIYFNEYSPCSMSWLCSEEPENDIFFLTCQSRSRF